MGTLIELGTVRTTERAIPPKGCKGAACPAFVTCQGRCAAKLALQAALEEAIAERRN